jgi:hypothetical protein
MGIEIDVDMLHQAMCGLHDAAMPLHNLTVAAEILVATLEMPRKFTLLAVENQAGDHFRVEWPFVEWDDFEDDGPLHLDAIWWLVFTVRHLAPSGTWRGGGFRSLSVYTNAQELLEITEGIPDAALHLIDALVDATRWVTAFSEASAMIDWDATRDAYIAAERERP